MPALRYTKHSVLTQSRTRPVFTARCVYMSTKWRGGNGMSGIETNGYQALASLSSPDTTNWPASSAFKCQQVGGKGNHKAISEVMYQTIDTIIHLIIMSCLRCSDCTDLQLKWKWRNYFSITQIKHRTLKHTFFFCNIENRLAENFTYIEKALDNQSNKSESAAMTFDFS